MSRLMTKPTNWPVHRAKTQISIGIRPFWSESSLCAWSESSLSTWRNLGSLATHWAHMYSEVSDQTGWMPRLIWVFAGCTDHFVGFSWGGSNVLVIVIYLSRLYCIKLPCCNRQFQDIRLFLIIRIATKVCHRAATPLQHVLRGHLYH